MTACDGYLPVPTTRREPNVRPAMTRGSEFIKGSGLVQGSGYGQQAPGSLSAADEPHDFDLVALADHRGVVLLTFDDHDVVLDRDDAGIDLELGEQRADGDRAGDLERLAVQSYRQSLLQPFLPTVLCSLRAFPIALSHSQTAPTENSPRTCFSRRSPLVTRWAGSVTRGAGRAGRVGEHAFVVLEHPRHRVLALPVSPPGGAERRAQVRVRGQPPHRQAQRMILVQDVDGDVQRQDRDPGSGWIGSGIRSWNALTLSPSIPHPDPDPHPGSRSCSILHVRGSSDGTSARCARSIVIVGRPAASARSQGPDISRAVGQRRLSETSHAAMQSVSSFVGAEIAGDRHAALEARSRTSAATS